MWRYIASRIGQALLIVAAITLAVFIIMRVTAGDPARIRSPQFADPSIINQYRKEFGTDRSLFQQLVNLVGGMFHGDLGTSFRYGKPTVTLVGEYLPRTLELAGLALLIALPISILLGVLAARFPRTPFGWGSTALATVGQSMPVFVTSLLFSVYLGVKIRLFPAGGYSGFSSVVLPAVAVALSMIPTELRVLRVSMQTALRQDYIRAARASGASELRVTFVYALRNASLPMLTVVGIDVGYLLGGVIVAEVVFNYPGIGFLALTALNSRDYPLIQAITIVASATFVLVNLLIDLLYVVIDPRIRLQTS